MTDEFEMPIRCLKESQPKSDKLFDVTNEIDSILEMDNKKPWSRKTGVYHPSALHGCKRAIYYDVIGTEPRPQIDAKLQMLFDLGHAIHDSIQGRLSDAYEDFTAEVPVSVPPLKLYGHCDGVFKNKDWIFEIKTIGDSSFSSLVRPKKEHILQVHCYMFALDIPRCQLLYVNRNNGRMRLFRVLFDNEVWEQATSVISQVEAHVKDLDPPPQEPNKWVCTGCKFRYTCNPSL